MDKYEATDLFWNRLKEFYGLDLQSEIKEWKNTVYESGIIPDIRTWKLFTFARSRSLNDINKGKQISSIPAVAVVDAFYQNGDFSSKEVYRMFMAKLGIKQNNGGRTEDQVFQWVAENLLDEDWYRTYRRVQRESANLKAIKTLGLEGEAETTLDAGMVDTPTSSTGSKRDYTKKGPKQWKLP